MEEMMGPLQEVFRDLKQKWRDYNDQEPFLDVLMGFIHAIDWTERWIIGILAFHSVMILLALLTRKKAVLQGIIFCVAMIVTFYAETLNTLGAQNWPRFASQNYFDATGVFMSAVVSGPLLFTMFIVLINYLVACAQMLVQAKRKELIYKAKQRAKQDAAAAKKTD